MTESSTTGRWGSQPVDESSDTEVIPAALAKADQMAWEAPDLRPVKIRFDDKPMKLASPCPDWCDQKGTGHDPRCVLAVGRQRRQREHQGMPLRVALEMLYPYESGNGAEWGHLELRLVQTARNNAPLLKVGQES